MNDNNEVGKTFTINDVARQSGVSKRTVSRFMNGAGHVGKATRERIEAVVRALNYSPNTQARGLASRRSYLIGLVYDNPDALYLNDVQRGVIDTIANEGYELVVHPCRYRGDALVSDCLSFLQRSKLDGAVILPPVSEIDTLAAAIAQQGVPYVRLASVAIDEPARIIVSDDRAAAAEMARYFVQSGHRHIAFISGPLRYRSSLERLDGFQLGLSAYGLPLSNDHIIEGQNTFETGLVCAERLLALTPRPTAIFANNDEMAAAVLKVAHRLGLAVPAQLSVAGFDDNLLASRLTPALTTIRRPVQKMAAAAAEKLLLAINHPDDPALQNVARVIPELVVRESTCAAS